MTAEREALALAKSAIGRLEQAVSLLDDTFFYTEGYHKSIVEFTDRFAKIDQALANPATIRDTDEDAELVDALIRAARDVEWEAHFGAKWDARRATMLRARERVLSRLASSTPAEPREASGYCPFCMTADPVSRA